MIKNVKNSMNYHKVVILGGGFGGLRAAHALKKLPVDITLIDRRNFHLFQPLLYQVATGGLSPGDIVSPLRAILKKQKNVQVLLDKALDINPDAQVVITKHRSIQYDTLIVATGAKHSYFGNDSWEKNAPGLKNIEDATEIRRRILLAFEQAERELDSEKRRRLLNFVIVGAGPTGVELAGSMAELVHHTMKDDFRSINPTSAQITLIEGSDRILPSFEKYLSVRAEENLKKMGVTIRKNCFVTNVENNLVHIRCCEGEKVIESNTIIWAAGVQASTFGKTLATRTQSQTDRSGRIYVQDNLRLAKYNNIFVIGDLAHCKDEQGNPLPGVVPVAMQQGSYVAKELKCQINNKTNKPFKYFDKGSMAVIGRSAAVAQVKFLKLWGFPAWFAWLFIHILYLIEFENRILVMIQWGFNYFTRKRGARLITETSKSKEID